MNEDTYSRYVANCNGNITTAVLAAETTSLDVTKITTEKTFRDTINF